MVSEADRNVEQLMKHLIHERFPQDGILGKESGGKISGVRFIWVIGVVSDPNHQETFHACRGKGS